MKENLNKELKGHPSKTSGQKGGGCQMTLTMTGLSEIGRESVRIQNN